MGMGGAGLRAAGVGVCLMVAGCNSTATSGSMTSGLEALLYGGSVPPSGPGLASEFVCPRVTIAPGGAAINTYAGGGGPETLRTQLSIVNVARECNRRPDGSVVVKVGVEGRALVGPGGGSGRLEAPVRFAIKRGEQVVASASRRASVALTAGQAQGTFLVVEEGLVAPASLQGDFDIEVGLGGSAERPARRARR